MTYPIDQEPGVGEPVQPAGGTSGGGGGGSSGSDDYAIGTAIFNYVYAKADPTSVLKVLSVLNCASPDDLQFIAYLIIDGTVAQAQVVNLTFTAAASQAQLPVTLTMYATGLAAGDHRIVVSVLNKEASGDPLTVKAPSTIEIEEIKTPNQ